jgi:N-methylhydantoinase B
MPDGEWSAEGFMDDDGLSDDPIPLKITVKVSGNEMVVDTSECPGPQKGSANCPIATTVSEFRCIFMSIIDPYYEPNEGFFRSLHVEVPEISMFNAKPPSACTLYCWAAEQLANLFHTALAEAIPEKVVARSGGDMGGFLWSVENPRDGASTGGGVDVGLGDGAGMDHDGENAMVVWQNGDCYNIPVEIWEERFPFFIEKYTLWQDSGGAGKWRGGLGTQYIFHAEDDIHLVLFAEATKFPAWGLFGGKSALPTTVIANPNTPRMVSGKGPADLHKGDVLLQYGGGGGGFGDPLEREPEKVLNDVINEYVSIEKAKEDYGVIINNLEGEYTIDIERTEKLRNKKKKSE